MIYKYNTPEALKILNTCKICKNIKKNYFYFDCIMYYEVNLYGIRINNMQLTKKYANA